MTPIVSCVVPTTEARRPFMEQVLRCFDRQVFLPVEMIIVDDGHTALELRDDVHRLTVPEGWTIGRKINAGAEEARGDIVIKWDDDDWYSPLFVSTLAPVVLARPRNSVAAVGTYVSFLLEDWKLRYSGGANAFAGATLCFAKETWRQRPFDEKIVVGEDLDFCHDRERLPVFPPPFLYTMIRHKLGHTWNEWHNGTVENVFRKRPEFPQTPEEFLPPEDVAFYRKLAQR